MEETNNKKQIPKNFVQYRDAYSKMDENQKLAFEENKIVKKTLKNEKKALANAEHYKALYKDIAKPVLINHIDNTVFGQPIPKKYKKKKYALKGTYKLINSDAENTFVTYFGDVTENNKEKDTWNFTSTKVPVLDLFDPNFLEYIFIKNGRDIEQNFEQLNKYLQKLHKVY